MTDFRFTTYENYILYHLFHMEVIKSRRKYCCFYFNLSYSPTICGSGCVIWSKETLFAPPKVDLP